MTLTMKLTVSVTHTNNYFYPYNDSDNGSDTDNDSDNESDTDNDSDYNSDTNNN